VPKAGKLLFVDVSWEGDRLFFSYRERGTGFGGTITFSARSARTVARVLEGTLVTRHEEPARLELGDSDVRQHVEGRESLEHNPGTSKVRIELTGAEVLEHVKGRTKPAA
jgi:hypothetical protein